ncbi:F0F1 ATP synthase subunit delta [Aliiruegeria sabulilitoris]|uniref:F0F1 ATP synthase subunit delta n=1 Tax=Aliiruegeria sabulilitoris TaxID=1510458 RepID=UPI00082A8BAE|nr:F0F1 ATP synthase subunit delta [Aliiruegeria sabulilitoris]NDR58442.1 hypothetical protein [Pseudoruegeria sp. M32A2M]
MTIDWWTLGLQTVNLVVLVWILARFLFRPVSRIIAERRAAAHAALDEADAARRLAEAARDEARAAAEKTEALRAQVLATAREEATSETRRLLNEARTATDLLRAEGASELERMRREQQRALSREAGELAADIAGKLLDRLPDSARISGFVGGLAEAVAALPEASRRDLGAGGTVRLRAARDLTGTERTLLEQSLKDALGHAPKLHIEIDPGLIAGLEIVGPHAIVRNHLRADLDRIREEMADNG